MLFYLEGVVVVEILCVGSVDVEGGEEIWCGLCDIFFGGIIVVVFSVIVSGLKLFVESISFWFIVGVLVVCLIMGFLLVLVGVGYMIGIVFGIVILIGLVIVWGVVVFYFIVVILYVVDVVLLDFVNGLWKS